MGFGTVGVGVTTVGAGCQGIVALGLVGVVVLQRTFYNLGVAIYERVMASFSGGTVYHCARW